MAKTTTKQENKAKWHTAETLLIKGGMIERDSKDNSMLKAIVLLTNEGKEIKYYPRQRADVKTNLGEWETVTKETKKIPVTEFIINAKLLNRLNAKCKSGEYQEIILSYQEKLFNDKIYYTFGDNQYNNLAYKEFDTPEDFNKKIENMKTANAKAEAMEEFPIE